MRSLRLFVRISAALCVAAAAMWWWSGSHAQLLRRAARSNVVLHLPFPSDPAQAAYYRTYSPGGDRAYTLEDRPAMEWADGHVWFVQEREWPWRRARRRKRDISDISEITAAGWAG